MNEFIIRRTKQERGQPRKPQKKNNQKKENEVKRKVERWIRECGGVHQIPFPTKQDVKELKNITLRNFLGELKPLFKHKTPDGLIIKDWCHQMGNQYT